jgi:hypothetical protein
MLHVKVTKHQLWRTVRICTFPRSSVCAILLQDLWTSDRRLMFDGDATWPAIIPTISSGRQTDAVYRVLKIVSG